VEDELKKAVALDPKSVNAKLLARGILCEEQPLGRRPKRPAGMPSLRIPRALPPGKRRQIFLKEGDQARAEEVLRQASKDLADNPQGVRILADYYEGSGQMDKAKAEFSSLAAKYPKNISVQKGYIRVLLEVKDYGTAQTVVAELMKKNSKDPEVAGLNGIVLLNDGKASDAVNALQNASRFPQGRLPAVLAGQGGAGQGRYRSGRKSLRQAMESESRPGWTRRRNWRG
jgi:tetratricopeptide (TPR) repeat protein